MSLSLEEQLERLTIVKHGKKIKACTNAQLYDSVLQLVKEQLDDKPLIKGKKKVYYISMEFLIGKLLSNNLMNLGIYEELAGVLLDPIIFLRFLKPVLEHLLKQAVVVIQADAISGQSQTRDGIQKTGCQTA